MIRHANHADLPALLPLAKGIHALSTVTYYGQRKEGEPGGWNPGTMSAYLAGFIDHEDMLCVVADCKHGLVGFALAVVAPIHDDPRATLCQEAAIWTDPEFMGIGLGAELVDAIEEFAKSKGCEMVMFGTNRSMNPRAVGALYRSLGFSEIGRLYGKRLETCHH